MFLSGMVNDASPDLVVLASSGHRGTGGKECRKEG
jgi:hypothetical protein